MNLNGLLQMAWKWISPKVPNANTIMNKAMEIGNQEGSTAAVMGLIESWARNNGRGGILENNQIWTSFKNKPPQDVIPHGQKLLKESGKFDFLLNLIGANKSS